jgi:hypothetical protein
MRILAYLNRRYTVRESFALLIPAVAVVLGVQLGLTALGISRPIAALMSLTAALGVYFATAALIDRRTRG